MTPRESTAARLVELAAKGVGVAVLDAVKGWLATVPGIHHPSLDASGGGGGVKAEWAGGEVVILVEPDGTAKGTYYADADVFPASVVGQWADLHTIARKMSDMVLAGIDDNTPMIERLGATNDRP